MMIDRTMMHDATPFIEAARLYLRGVSLADADGRYQHWMHDPMITRYLESRFRPHAPEALREYIANVNADPAYVFLAIVLKDGRRHIGNIKLGPINWLHRFADVGILIGERDCWGQGFATEAIQAMTDFAFRHLNLHRLTAGCYATNGGSARAFVKAGWQQEGVRRAHFFSDGSYVDELLLGIVRPDGSGS